jgi:hypothetical protein
MCMFGPGVKDNLIEPNTMINIIPQHEILLYLKLKKQKGLLAIWNKLLLPSEYREEKFGIQNSVNIR